jgi:preprotein translocase subunit SecY
MLGTVFNIFRIPDLRNKILFTVALLIIYRVGFHIPNPGFDQSKITEVTRTRDTDSPLGRAAEYMQIFTGGTLDKSSLFGLGIMPYITASIILMLLGEVVPALKKLRQEGQTNRLQKDTGVHALFDGADMCYPVDDVYEDVRSLYLCWYAHSSNDNGSY